MKLETSRPLTLVAALAALSTVHCGGPLSEDGTGEPSLAHVSQAQIPECHLVTENPTYDIRWTQGLSLTLDETILRDYWPSDCVTYGPCNISYYRIQWFDGTWSQYYTPGSNDVDWVTNYDGTQRRVWSYFYDHPHQYQYCTN